MPHVSQMFSSKYLTKEDCMAGPIVTIRDCRAETFQQFGQQGATGAQTRWILYFHEANKGLKLNTTIINVLAAGFGENSEQWVGKRVRLYVDQTVMMAGQVVGGIRIQLPRAAPTEVGFQKPGAFKESAFAPPQTASPPPGAALQPSAGLPHTAARAAVDSEFDDQVPF